jgi:hypothetical protein
VSAGVHGYNGAKGTYKFKGEWGSLDHVLCSNTLMSMVFDCHIADYQFLLVDDDIYGGVQPFRNFRGAKYLNGYSDHLPLIMKFRQ